MTHTEMKNVFSRAMRQILKEIRQAEAPRLADRFRVNRIRNAVVVDLDLCSVLSRSPARVPVVHSLSFALSNASCAFSLRQNRTKARERSSGSQTQATFLSWKIKRPSQTCEVRTRAPRPRADLAPACCCAPPPAHHCHWPLALHTP